MLPLAFLVLASPADGAFDPGPSPMLFRSPTLSATHIVFQFAGDLWSVPRGGGRATQITSNPGVESDPWFSPDGKWIAFSGQYDGNVDTFVIPAEGGVPKRLTAHPGADSAVGWTPDGKSVVIRSAMLSDTSYTRLFTVPTTGGVPKPLPFPAAHQGSFSPDGTKLAYVPNQKWQQAWKRYRGGQTTPIWIAQMSDSKWKAIPRENTNDESPMWIGDSIYFLSDKRGPVGLYRYDTGTGKVTEEIKGEGFDIKAANAGPGAIVYERFGSINLFDLATKTSKRVPIEVHGDFPEVRPQFKDLATRISGIAPSPSGQRLAVTARGWAFTVPASKGDARLLSETQGLNRRDPEWSPDGKTIAYLTDEKGTQALVLHDATTGKDRRIELGEAPNFYYRPTWSPDSTKIAYTDVRLNLWVLDVATGVNRKIDTGVFRGGTTIFPNWSPDSKWLTWSRDLDNHLNAIFLHSLDSGKTTQVTDGLAEATDPVFDRDGKHLYFLASTTTGLAADGQDIANHNAPNVTSNVYALVLRKDLPNPLQPESDEEVPKDSAKKPEAPKAPEPFRIDLDGLESRIVTLPFPNAIYTGLEAGPAGTLFASTSPPRPNAVDFGGGASTLHKFTLSDRKVVPFAVGVNGYVVTADGNKIMLRRGAGVSLVPTAGPAAAPGGDVDLSGLRVKIDPRAEWRAMYREVWRNQRHMFYDPGFHGADLALLERRYEPFLANVSSRSDLNYLFTDMLGELTVGHMFIGGGDIPGARSVPGGLLGADYAFENGRYRLTRIYDGERWNPGLYAPLAQPGVNAKAGEYLLAIDGKDLTDATDIYEALEAKAGRQVKVKLGPSPDGKDAREVVVLPVASEGALRNRAWSEDNRRKVEKMTNGRVGYVHVPDTSSGGWREFNRYYYAQSAKEGMVVDERFNSGGLITDYLVREMIKGLVFGSRTRYGKDWQIPPSAVYGPKAMIVNEMAGSGGDILPYVFRFHKAGPIIGKRTWGAMISNYGFNLIDGGRVSSPDDAIYDPASGEWVIENEGTAPDIDVELDPYLWRQGRDAQLERAVAEVMKQLSAQPRAPMKRPDYPKKNRLPDGK
ncbi:MAG: S41 family peptidase [Fimbriimonas sp.]